MKRLSFWLLALLMAGFFTFSVAALSFADCPDFTLACQPKDGRPYERGKDITVGQCWKWGCGSFPYFGCCKLCRSWPNWEYDNQCNQTYPDYCRGNCRGG